MEHAALGVGLFALALVVGGLILLLDTVRSVRCSECPHCQTKIEDEKRAYAWANHKTYHSYTTNVPGCEFCEQRGEQ